MENIKKLKIKEKCLSILIKIMYLKEFNKTVLALTTSLVQLLGGQHLNLNTIWEAYLEVQLLHLLHNSLTVQLLKLKKKLLIIFLELVVQVQDLINLHLLVQFNQFNALLLHHHRLLSVFKLLKYLKLLNIILIYHLQIKHLN